MKNRNRKWLSILATIFAISFLLFFDFGKLYSRTATEILNFGHLILFGSAAVFLLWVFHREGSSPPYGKVAAITIFLGILSEFIQLMTPSRDFELRDMFADTLGAVIFLVVAYTLREDLSPSKKRFIRTVSILLILAMLGPVFSAVIDDWSMQKDFPLLGSFESCLEKSRWTVEGSNTIKRVKQHAADGEYSLKTVLLSGQYPGVALEYLIPDWRGFSSLDFDAFYEGTVPLKITVRIHDRKHNQQYNDRYNESFLLQHGDNHLSIGLDKVRNAPGGRQMDMTAIEGLCIFTTSLKEPRIIYLDNVRLKK
jgi:glycopeptide antibiotics resistance protein